MAVKELRKALAMLESLKDHLPKGGRIDIVYVEKFHRTLSDIQTQINEDLTYFKIPASELSPEPDPFLVGIAGGYGDHSSLRRLQSRDFLNKHECCNEIYQLTYPGLSGRNVADDNVRVG